MPHTRQTRARPYGMFVEGEVAWLIVSTSWAVKGGAFRAARSLRAAAQFPSSLRPVFGVHGRVRGRGYRAVGFAGLPGPRRGTPHAKWGDGRRVSPVRVTPDQAVPHVTAGGRPRSAAVQKTAGVSATHLCAPLQSLSELLAREALWIILVDSSGHLL